MRGTPPVPRARLRSLQVGRRRRAAFVCSWGRGDNKGGGCYRGETPLEAPRGAEGEGMRREPRLSRPVAAGTGGHPLPPSRLPPSLTRARRAQPAAPPSSPPSSPPALAPVKPSPASLRPAPPRLSAAAAGPARLLQPRPALTWVLPPPPGGSGEGARCARHRGGDVMALPAVALLREMSAERTAEKLLKKSRFSACCVRRCAW